MTSSISSGIASLFYKLDTTSKGYLSKTDMESAFAQVSGSSDNESADSLFATLDADSNGQLTQSEFSAGVEKLMAALNSQFYQMRSNQQGHMPPPPQGKDEGFTKDQLSEIASTTSDSNLASLMSSLADNFDAADTNGDGEITHDEAMSYAGIADDGAGGRMQAMNGMPPPPGADEGFTQDQLSEIASTTSDSKLASLMSNLADNFDAADTNGDGKITHDEAMSYQQAQKSDTATAATSTTGSDVVSSLLKIIQMMQAYSTNDSEQSQYSLAVA